jgi:hypothetical protein
MPVEPSLDRQVRQDVWLEGQCRIVEAAGRELALAVGEANDRIEHGRNGTLGRKVHVTEANLRRSAHALGALHDVQVAIQDALFDCEHELRALRERDMSPAELLVDGHRLVSQYRFIRRRARIIDALLAYLPVVQHHAGVCHEHLRRLRDGEPVEHDGSITVPDCGFALVALEALQEDDPDR